MSLRHRTTILAAVAGIVLTGAAAAPANAAGTCDKPTKPAASPAKPAPAPTPAARLFSAEGTLSVLDAVAGKVTVTGEKGAATTVTVAPAATVTLDKAVSKLVSLPLGAKVRVSGSVNDGVKVAVRVEAASNRPFVMGGSLVSVNQGEDTTITVKRLDATEVVPVATTAKVTLDGRAAKLGDLPAKARLVVLGTTTNGIRWATSITALSRWQLTLSATVSAVDAANGTITVSTGQPATSLKLNVNPDVTVRVNGVKVALKDLPVGATVNLTGSETTVGASIAGIDAKVALGKKS